MSAGRPRCVSGKRRYPDRVSAELALIRIREEYDEEGRDKLPCRSYACRKCRGHHLTSQPLNEPAAPAPEADQ